MSKSLPPLETSSRSRDGGRALNCVTPGPGIGNALCVLSPGSTINSHLNTYSPQKFLDVEFTLGPLQDQGLPPYNDLEDPYLAPYWARREILIRETAERREELKRRRRLERQKREVARRRFVERRQRELEELACRRGVLTQRRAEAEEEEVTNMQEADRSKRRMRKKRPRHLSTRPVESTDAVAQHYPRPPPRAESANNRGRRPVPAYQGKPKTDSPPKSIILKTIRETLSSDFTRSPSPKNNRKSSASASIPARGSEAPSKGKSMVSSSKTAVPPSAAEEKSTTGLPASSEMETRDSRTVSVDKPPSHRGSSTDTSPRGTEGGVLISTEQPSSDPEATQEDRRGSSQQVDERDDATEDTTVDRKAEESEKSATEDKKESYDDEFEATETSSKKDPTTEDKAEESEKDLVTEDKAEESEKSAVEGKKESYDDEFEATDTSSKKDPATEDKAEESERDLTTEEKKAEESDESRPSSKKSEKS
ncbi:unnamed protein product, partial [Trypanosoma congolense IL3000]